MVAEVDGDAAERGEDDVGGGDLWEDGMCVCVCVYVNENVMGMCRRQEIHTHNYRRWMW